MRFCKLSFAARLFLASALTVCAWAQSTPQIDGDAVRRVASHIACQCGACKETASCPMSMQGCGFCVPARVKIAKMQAAGFSDQAIIDSFKKEYGTDIYRAGPASSFWMVPYGLLIAGVLAILWFVRRYVKAPQPVTAGGPDDPAFAKYHAAIEKEAGRFD